MYYSKLHSSTEAPVGHDQAAVITLQLKGNSLLK